MKRSRYTVTTQRGPQVVLAYSPQGAREFFERRGYTVTGVAKGDYRKQTREAAIKAAGGFRIDSRAVREAMDALGIKLPVEIRYHSRVGSTNGNYRFEGTHHNIMVKSYHTAAQATETLWHELTHAMQAERVGGGASLTAKAAWASYTREQARYSYRSRPIEVEARAMASRMKDCPLARPANSPASSLDNLVVKP